MDETIIFENLNILQTKLKKFRKIREKIKILITLGANSKYQKIQGPNYNFQKFNGPKCKFQKLMRQNFNAGINIQLERKSWED